VTEAIAIDGMTNAEYHARPELSASGLTCAINQSLLHYWSQYESPEDQRQERTETPAMAFGTAFHTAILEPKRWRETYIADPGPGSRKKADIAAHAEWVASLPEGAVRIKPETRSQIDAMRGAVMASPFVEDMLAAAEAIEQSLFWEEDGIACRARPDLRTRNVLIDFKTSADASPYGFRRSAAKLRYDVQMAHYASGVEAITERPVQKCVWVVAEKKPPFAVGIYTIDADWLDSALTRREAMMQDIAKARRTGQWAGYGCRTLSDPGW
jgi:exodeoxyribonuclease VIII